MNAFPNPDGIAREHAEALSTLNFEKIVADLPATILTAAQRGQEWMLRWGCTPWCINDHTDPASPDFHNAGETATELRATDLEPCAIDQPWLTAETVVMNDKPWAYGRETRVLLGYGDHLAELTPDDARKALDAMRGFIAQLEAVVDQADASALDDFDGDPEIARLDMQAADRRAGRAPRAGGAA